MSAEGLKAFRCCTHPNKESSDRAAAGLDSALTTVMWMFVQSTCPQLNTDSDRGGMATSFLLESRSDCKFPLETPPRYDAVSTSAATSQTGHTSSDRSGQKGRADDDFENFQSSWRERMNVQKPRQRSTD